MTRTGSGHRRAVRRLITGTVIGAGIVIGFSRPASAATVATFSDGVLTVMGDGSAETITISRAPAGAILVNGGAISVGGGVPTVANTSSIQVFGHGGNDTITLDEVAGALPRANLFGGPGNDTLTGGSGSDMVFGQAGNDTLLGRGGQDSLFGGSEHDTLTGGDSDDLVYGEGGDDVMLWNPGDDTDLNEGGSGNDKTEVRGAGGAEDFTLTANGTRVRFDRLDPAPFALDIGTTETVVLRAGGGDDTFAATGNLAALVVVGVDGGAGDDTIRGGNGIDLLIGGEGADFIDGQQGNDLAILGADDDRFQWDPGDGSDIVIGQSGTDRLEFNGSGAGELFTAEASGQNLRFTRNVGNIVMETSDVEVLDVRSLGGADTVTVGDLTGTHVTSVDVDLAGTVGGSTGDAQPDNVIATGTGGDDVVFVAGDTSGTSVFGLAAQIGITGTEAANDRLTVNAVGGDDVVDASGLASGAIALTADGGIGNDVLIGGAGADVLLGGPGDDVLFGGPGVDILDGGGDDDIAIQSVGGGGDTRRQAADLDQVLSARVADSAWLVDHVRIVDGRTVVQVGATPRTVPAADLAEILHRARAELDAAVPAVDAAAPTAPGEQVATAPADAGAHSPVGA